MASLKMREQATESIVIPQVDGRANCGSANVHKWGWRYSKKGERRTQVFKCQVCHSKFSGIAQGFEKMQANPHAVTVALDLYFKGVSLRKITDHLKQFERLNVGHTTVFYWIHKYIGLMKSYVDTVKPNLSRVWHADEMKINVNGQWVYLWNLMDSDTRFMLSMRVAKGRTASEAEAVFREAKANAKAEPKVLLNDGLPSYNPAFEKVFGESDTIHLSGVGIRGALSNNRIERFHGTYRERTKVMRGFHSMNGSQAITDGERIYQNFIRPHTALKGQTPAEAAGIDLSLTGNKWKMLIQKATMNKAISSGKTDS